MKGNSKIVIRILFTLMFVIFSTIFVYLPEREEMAGALGLITSLDKVRLNSISGPIFLDKNYPVVDKVGLESEEMAFEVVSNSKDDVQYTLSILSNEVDKDVQYLELSNIRYSISVNGSKYSEPRNLDSEGIIDTNIVKTKGKNIYSLKLWIDYDSDNSVYGKTFSCVLVVEN